MNAGTDGRTGRVLVVEDDFTNRRVVEAKLHEAGYETVSHVNGPEALAFIASEEGATIDLVLLDVMMPGMDGFEVLERIRMEKSAIQLPVIMATALDKTADIVRALESGANDFVTKPVNLPVLVSRLRTHLSFKRAHQELRESHRSLVQAAKMECITLLVAGVAHEIRNPLAQIQMGLDGLRQFAPKIDAPNFRSALETLADSVDRADAIVRGLISSTASQKLQTEPGDLNRLLSDTCDLLAEEELAGSGVAIRRVPGDVLPPVSFSSVEMRQVLIHVLLNAARAMPGGGMIDVATRQVSTSGIPTDEGARSGFRLRNGVPAVEIEIADEGSGVTDEVLTRMFDPFFTTRATGQGTGLGLTVVRKIMELHGGAVVIENRTDRSGLRVRLMLPAKRTSLI